MYYRVLLRFEGKYRIGEMCQVFDVGYSGYYKWRRRKQMPDRDAPLMELIQARYDASNQSAGYRQITCQIRKKFDLIVNHKAVYRVMKKMGLQSIARRRRPYMRYSESIYRYDNILNRDFLAERPNNKWVTDITYIPTKQGILYLSAIKDLYDGFIVAYRTGTEQTVNLVTMTIQDAMKMAADGPILHSDQGFQYTSEAYFRLTQQYGITPSMSRRGDCLDNACMENFFGMLKTEWLRRRKFASLAAAREAIYQYVQYYNYERCNLKTRLTPYEKRCQSA
jgi:putative transposase